MTTKVKITGKKRYPANYEVRWVDVNDTDNSGIISISTDGLINGDYYSEEDYGDDDNYIEEGFNSYVLEKAKEELEGYGYEVVEVSDWNF
jgi:hypothetical protein